MYAHPKVGLSQSSVIHRTVSGGDLSFLELMTKVPKGCLDVSWALVCEEISYRAGCVMSTGTVNCFWCGVEEGRLNVSPS